ncbi:MAG TPA: ABC transporter ATP-binding protein/permease [Arenicellales bacterium]|jgi:ATP-binding cassette subfamily B protein|nr:ABC transporter ATP-binding protein/permease [Arenicellales bacterium]HJP06802.1 ABC transporter ATP-binding protein/permease [Arenicellales bacterium]|tara:strand:+ start:12343 stop:14151 length:1809 start_codon:yes stop_codon:yes gene_type:complete
MNQAGRSHSLRTFFTLLPYLWPSRRHDLQARVIVALLSLVLAKAANVYVPLVLGDAVDQLGNLDQQQGLWLGIPLAVILAYGAFKLSSLVLNQLRDALFARVAQNAVRTLALRVFRHLHALSVRFHLSRKTGALNRFIDRGTNSIQFLLSFVAFNIAPTLIEVLLVGGILWALFGFVYTAVTIVTIAVYVWLTFVITAWRTRIRRQMNDADNDISTRTVDSLLNFETVRYFNNEAHEVNRLDSALADYEKAAVRTRESLSLLNVAQAAVITVGVTLMLVLAALDIRDGDMTVGDFVVVNTYLMQLAIPLNMLGTVYREIRQAMVDMENLFSLMDESTDVADAADARPLKHNGGAIEFRNVDFNYETERRILHNVSFTVDPGTTTAIVGPTGAGKSTISRLLLRFYDPQAGQVLIDGQDIRSITQHSLRRAIGVVPQDTVLFNDNLYYNIAYGDPQADRDRILAAARAAHLHDFIENLPAGYETLVGERGLKLSGGEKQRVAIARALLRNPEIFFFDEATSSLDSATENEIQNNLARISQGRTSLVIAHRLSTVVNADQILVLEDGQITEQGTHPQLLTQNGLYAQLWRQQKKEELEKSSASD